MFNFILKIQFFIQVGIQHQDIILKNMNKKAIFFAFLAATLIGTFYFVNVETKDYFYRWKIKYGFSYSESENQYRKMVFHRNVEIIKSHNSDHNRTYDMGLNQFSAYTDDEFAALFLAPKPYNPEWQNVETTIDNAGLGIDWSAQGKVSPVKNQGQCGSCWAFSAVSGLESLAIFQGKHVNLSEQQLIDCSNKYGNQGCNGGSSYQGLSYVKDYGITTAAAYPYIGKTGACRIEGGSFKIGSVNFVKGCADLQNAAAERVISISADATNWSKYSSGIFSNCGTHLNHDITLVGYTNSYWKVKNSWGTSWGEKGYMKLAKGNTCGVCMGKSSWPQ